LLKYRDFDVVQLLNPFFFPVYFGYNEKLISRIIKQNDKTFLTSAGCDSFVYKSFQKSDYSPCNSCKVLDLKSKKCRYEKNIYQKSNNKIADMVNGIIPVLYEYTEAYRNHPKYIKTIPLPINTDKNEFMENIVVNKKLIIFHGINRIGFKGTEIIKEALSKIKEKYPNDVDIIIDGKMPLAKYLNIMKKTNIIIDQCYSYSYGMNALYGMALGKVVLSGNKKSHYKDTNIIENPIINIKPSVSDIYKKLLMLVENKSLVAEIGYRSRKFVEYFHNYKKIASDYIDVWNHF
jgi:glycosyltransferase involved in cell wall biosynthesis